MASKPETRPRARIEGSFGGAIGAVGGGLPGNAIESHERTPTADDVRVRMADGLIRTIRQATMPGPRSGIQKRQGAQNQNAWSS